jgi:predicted Zn-dependent peptidase
MNINGYKIIYIPTVKNITSVHAYIRTGSLCENISQSGIAHLLEHVITDAWNKCSGNCTKFWSKKGIITNAQTNTLYTRYYIVGLTKEIENMIDYMASIITKPVFDAKCIERSRHAVKDELLIRTNNPEWKIYDTFFKSIKDNTEYDGFSRMSDYPLKISNLDTITKKEIINYYDKWYRPDNMFFVVVSDKPFSKINYFFGKYLHKRPSLTFPKFDISIKCINCTSIIHRKDAEKSTFVIGFINNNQHSQDFLYYNLILDMLTGDVSSLLYRILRDKMKLIYGIKLYFDMDKSYILSMFEVSCQFKNEKKLINTLISTLKSFVSGKFDSELLSRSKERLTVIDMNTCRENTEFLNKFYADMYIMSEKIDMNPDQYIKFINRITKQELIQVAKRLFQFDKLLITCETRK